MKRINKFLTKILIQCADVIVFKIIIFQGLSQISTQSSQSREGELVSFHHFQQSLNRERQQQQ